MLRLTNVNTAAIILIFKQLELKVSLFEQLRVNFSFDATLYNREIHTLLVTS